MRSATSFWAIVTFVLGFGVTSAFAEVTISSSGNPRALLGDTVVSVLGSEQAGYRSLSKSRINRLSTLPPAESRYTKAFLEQVPTASGGSEWKCLSEALYFEARGEKVKGIFGVAEVILNRVDSPSYPDTICGVVNQGTGAKYRCQFTYTCDGLAETIHEPAAWKKVGKIARLMIDKTLPRTLTDGATHYHTRAVNPSWARKFPKTASIGDHYFYRSGKRLASN